jgi:hypothetical protein
VHPTLGILPRFQAFFYASAFFPVGRRSAARPSAGNANRWAAGSEFIIKGNRMRESDKQNGSKIKFKYVAVAVIFISCVSVITSCATIKTFAPTLPEFTLTPVDTTKTNTPTILPTSTLYISPTVAETPAQPNNATEKKDYLVYLSAPQIGEPQLTLYDPANNKHNQVLPITRRDNSFSLSKDNRLAFAKDGNVYVWNYPFTENTPTEIIFEGASTTEKAILCWSLDGRYLLLSETQTDSKKLLLWDGKNILDLFSYQGVISSYGTTWSNNEKLAFTENFIDNRSYVSILGEIFVWDGKNVVKVSQNPSAFPAWSKDGQLAFLSYQNEKYNILVWDGKSINNGAPDIKILAAPDLELSVNSNLTWTNSGSIVFTGRGKTDSHLQIYEWDGQTTRNVSQTPSHNNYRLAWRNDEYWSAHDYLTVYVYDNANQIVLETKGSESRWTQSGLLVFCRPNGINWTLSMWNGKDIVDVAHGDYVLAKWTNSNGESIVCTFG